MKWFMVSLVLSVVSFSCNPDDNSSTGNNLQTSDLSGLWKVRQFIDDGKDETYYFTGYTFVFSNDVITASKSGSNVAGTYALQAGSNNARKMVISFPDTEPWDELNEDWTVIEWSQNLLKLRHVSGGNGGIDDLTFEKVN